MELSVIVPTLDGREQLAGTLDSIATVAPDAEVIVVNGPSTDGTTGMVRDRSDVDVLVELADRSVNVARNAGLVEASGDAIAFVNQGLTLTPAWLEALEGGFQEGPVVTGPTHRPVRAGKTTEAAETRAFAGRSVTFCNADNLAVTRKLIEDLDGFDEYLAVGGARDLSHRVAGLDRTVVWRPDMAVERGVGADGGNTERDWGWKHRSHAYRLGKIYGLRPSTLARLFSEAGHDAVGTVREVLAGTRSPSGWLVDGRDVLVGTLKGVKDGLAARARDRSDRRNPRGVSTRQDRPVEVYDTR